MGGSHPRVWLGKGWGFWINSFPSQLCAVSRLPAAEGVAKWLPWVQRGCWSILRGTGVGASWDPIPAQSLFSILAWRMQDLVQGIAHHPLLPGQGHHTALNLALVGSRVTRTREKEGHTRVHDLAYWAGMEQTALTAYQGGSRPGVSFLTLDIFPSFLNFWSPGRGGQPGACLARGGLQRWPGVTSTDASPGARLGIPSCLWPLPSPPLP